jgi:hypothetical protein
MYQDTELQITIVEAGVIQGEENEVVIALATGTYTPSVEE